MSQIKTLRTITGVPSKFVPWSLLLTTSILAFVARLPFAGAEDIINARNNILVGSRTDFWGGFAPWFFTIYSGDNWEFVYAVLFSLFIILGSIAITKYFLAASKRVGFASFIFLAIAHYIVLLFALSFSRDGALLSFSWIGIGGFLLSKCYRKNYLSKLMQTLSCSFLILGFSFRPWLSLSLVLLFILLRNFEPGEKKNYLLINIAIVLSLLFMPLLIDQASKKFQRLESSFPEQQVMIMDASSMVCLGASTTVSNRAIDVLRTLPASKNANRRDLCGQWYPQSWASTVFYGDLTDGEKPALSMIPTNDFASYNNFKSAWLSLILTNMAEYVQAKLMLSSQFLLAGDSINAEIYSWRGLLLLPLETLKALRLVSIFPILTLLLWLSFRSRKNGLKNTRKIGHLKLLSAFYLSFCAMSVISFIGDNQRYLFTGSMLVILFSFLLELGYEE